MDKDLAPDSVQKVDLSLPEVSTKKDETFMNTESVKKKTEVNVEDIMQPHAEDKSKKDLILTGIVCNLSNDGVFGFIKPHRLLPTDYTNKSVYFRPKGIRYQEGDEVEFILREDNKTRPSARSVDLINRSQRYIKGASKIRQTPRSLGTIIKLDDGIGLIRMVGQVLEGLQGEYLGKLYFEESWVTCGYLGLVPGDRVDFIAGQKKNSTKLNAYQIKLIECKERSCEEIEKYLEQTTDLITKWEECETDLFSSVLCCHPMWMTIGQCTNLTTIQIFKVLDFVELLRKKTKGRNASFKQGMKSLAGSGFCESLKRCIIASFEDEAKCKLKTFILRILENVPEQSRLILQVIKLMLPQDQQSLDQFMFQALKLVVREDRSDSCGLNWNELSLVPGSSELLQTANDAQLSEVKVTGPYESAGEYMDIYFRLLRADCFSGLQTGIQSYLARSLNPQDMFVYTHVTLIGYHFLNSENGFAIALEVTPLKRIENWGKCSNLRFGNLLCLSPCGTFDDVIWATVADRDNKSNKVWIELCDSSNTMETTSCLIQLTKASGRIIMAESPTYYRAYEPVLRALQDIDPEELPFQGELIKMRLPICVTYSEEIANVDVPSSMDASQKAAFKQALQHRVAVVQGPPGTGKTFLGINIIEALSTCKSVKLPIVVLTYKNHALDEFLKGVMECLPDGVVRIGGRCKDDSINAINLQKIKRESSRYRNTSNYKLWLAAEQSERKAMDDLKVAITRLVRSKRFSLTALIDGFTEDQIESLLQGCRRPLKSKVYGTLWARDLIEIWRVEKPYIDNCTPHKIYSIEVKEFLNHALNHWLSNTKIVENMFQKLPQIQNTKGTGIPKSTESQTPNVDSDEIDFLDEEKERTAGLYKSRDYTTDIDVDKLLRENDSIELSPYAQMLAQETSLASIQQIQNVWSLAPYEKMVVIQVILWHHHLESEKRLEVVFTKYREACALLKEVDNEYKLSILKQKVVVGMTITGASINQSLLKILQPSVVLVEEAGEVLEPQITAILGTGGVEHLILIGDHKQLRPKVETYNLTQKYHFDISMMERLINNGYPVATLKLQNRMLPEMAELLLDIYPELESNLKRVEMNKPPDFIPSSIFLWTHDDPEQAGRSYCNKGEAQRVLKLALVFINMGYMPSQITILAAYQGQVKLLRSLLEEAKKDYADKPTSAIHTIDIAIHTIDMYQGDENDIIIVSLVRSNENGQIGFLKFLNRRCVAQSRARCGMYIVGNDATFLNYKGSCWTPLIKTMYMRNMVGNQFPIHCPNHKEITQIYATTADDLPLWEICKVRCNIDMGCGLHQCLKVCRPVHSHKYCDQIKDIVLPCTHPCEAECWRSLRDIDCKFTCSQMMLCGKHPCQKNCTPMHLHCVEMCSAPVEFVFEKCQHPGKKNCGQKENDIKCYREVTFKFAKCQHDGNRKCTQSEEDIFCLQKCTRTLTCGHPCEAKCWENPCVSEQCEICKKKREHERKEIEKAQQKEQAKARIAAKKELEEFVKENADFKYCCTDITKDSNSASVCYSIVDKAMKYIVPGNGWFPKVTKIEKITNHERQRIWLKAKSQMFDPMRIELKFLKTTQGAIKSIAKNGWKFPKHPQRDENYGRGIYFPKDSSKEVHITKTEQSIKLLLCEVLIGKAYTVNKPDNEMCLNKLTKLKYDSVFAPIGTGELDETMYSESVVYKSNQVLPRYVVYFNAHKIDMIPDVPSATSGKIRHLLLPKREFDDTDPLDSHFRIAESQFLRLRKLTGSNAEIKSVEYFINDKMTECFNRKKAEFVAKYKDASIKSMSKSILAFHGTAEENIESIMENNFSMEKCCVGVHGAGIYLSELPDISSDYAKGSNKLILCKVLPGKGYQRGRCNQNLEPGFDSHIVKEDTKGRAWAHVIFDCNQILPLYIISF